MSDNQTSITSRASWIGEAIHTFLHPPVDTRLVGAIRIGYAGLLLINVLNWGLDRERWFSESGVLPVAVAQKLVDVGSGSLFFVLPTDERTVTICHWLFVAQIVGLLVGWMPRLNAIGCFVWLVSFQHRNILIVEGEDIVFRLIGFLLIFMPLNADQSLRLPLLSRTRSSENPPGSSCSLVDGWAVRLLQCEMALIYFSAGWSKLLGESWRNGTALYYVMRLDEYWHRFPLPAVIGESPFLVRCLTWSVVAIELTVPVLIWFDATRRWALLAVLLFHLSCDYAMHLFLFHWIMLVGWLSFVRSDDVAWLLSLRKRWSRKTRQ